MKNLASRLSLAFSCCLVVLAGCIFIPYTGIQMDESLFAGPYYQQVPREFRIRLFHHDIPLMVMTYIGTLKTLLYWPLFAIFRTKFATHPLDAAWVLRFPTILLAALTVFIFFYLAERATSRRTAVIATLLLASDPTFLLTNTFDWGPVALEHLFLVTACVCLLKYAQDLSQQAQRTRDLFLGFFFLGLALWNKAIFVWALGALTCAGVSIFGREVSKMITRRHLATAAAAFLLGSLPFMIYNGHRRAETFRSNAHFEPAGAPDKFIHFRNALNGGGLFGYLVSEEWAKSPKAATSLHGRVSLYLRDHLGEHRYSGMEYATFLALLAVPLWWRSRAARFAVVFCAVGWFLMASTRDAGASIHHTVLLWPFPQLFVAIAISSLRWRWAGASIAALLVILNILVLNQYVAQFERYGPAGNFSDAMYTLSLSLPDNAEQQIYALDWGIQYPLDLLHNGRLKLDEGNEPFMSATPDPRASAYLLRPGPLFIAHPDDLENFTGVYKRFREAAAAAGCHPDHFRTVPDSNGRTVFEVFELACGK